MASQLSRMNIGLVIISETEWQPLFEKFQNFHKSCAENTHFFELHDCNMYIYKCKNIGIPDATAGARILIDDYKVKVLLSVGVSGCLRNCKVGDIVFFSMIDGDLCSGFLLKEEEYTKEFKNNRDRNIKACDQESFGVLQAAKESYDKSKVSVQTGIIRYISDNPLERDSKNILGKEMQIYGMKVVSLLLELFLKTGIFKFSPNSAISLYHQLECEKKVAMDAFQDYKGELYNYLVVGEKSYITGTWKGSEYKISLKDKYVRTAPLNLQVVKESLHNCNISETQSDEIIKHIEMILEKKTSKKKEEVETELKVEQVKSHTKSSPIRTRGNKTNNKYNSNDDNDNVDDHDNNDNDDNDNNNNLNNNPNNNNNNNSKRESSVKEETNKKRKI